MSDLSQSIERYFGRNVDGTNLDHYSLLGITPGCSDVGQIKTALKAAAATWKSVSSQPEANKLEAQQIAILIKQAQTVLLDPEQKRAYDAQWKDQWRRASETQPMVTASQPSSPIAAPITGNTAHAANATVASNASFASSAVSPWPAGDPYGEFEPSLLLGQTATATLPIPSAASRWNELEQSIPNLRELRSRSQEAEAAAQHARFNDSIVQRPAPNATSAENSPIARIELLRKSRLRKQRIYLGGFIVVAFVFLGVAGAMFYQNRQQLAAAEAEKSAPKNDKNPTTKPPIGSLANNSKTKTPPPMLPKVNAGVADDASQNQDSSMKDPAMSGSDKMEPAKDDKPKQVDAPEMTAKDPVTVPITAPTTPENPTTPEPKEPAKPESPTKPAEEMTMEPTTPAMTADSKKQWNEKMKAARAAIDKADFAKFGKLMEELIAMPGDAVMDAKRARLDQMGQLYEIYINAMKEARKKTRGTDVLTVGKNKVNIVEVRDDVLIVRVAGKNERYPWDKLPPGIALAMAEITLSESEPTDVAARAIYFSLAPTKNEATDKKVKAWFEKSLGKGDVRKDLDQALTDKYE